MPVNRVEKKGFPFKFRLIRVIPLFLTFLLVEFYDEWTYSIGGAALPSLRLDLKLTYAQVGLMLGLPQVFKSVLEPAMMVLGDTGLRKKLIAGGGIVVAASCTLIATARVYPALLLGVILNHLAFSAFGTLSQVALMDAIPGRETQSMARWSFAGSLGNLTGPLFLAAGFALALGWRWIFYVEAVIALFLAALVWLKPMRSGLHPVPSIRNGSTAARDLALGLWQAARTPVLLRWIFLGETADLLMDIFISYLPLYLTDIAGFTPAQASLLLSAYLLAALISDAVQIPILERFNGRKVLRFSAAVVIGLYVTWLAAPWAAAKIGLLLMISFGKLGWYSILSGEAYKSYPARPGTVRAVGSAGNLLNGGLVWAVGWAASRAGLAAAMWILLLGPLSLLLFAPAARQKEAERGSSDA